jgi:hypothetical protein
MKYRTVRELPLRRTTFVEVVLARKQCPPQVISLWREYKRDHARDSARHAVILFSAFNRLLLGRALASGLRHFDA